MNNQPTAQTTTTTSMQAETHDDKGRLIYHIVDRTDLKTLGMSMTACGKLMFDDGDVTTGETAFHKDRKSVMCPMCAYEYYRTIKA